jgi:CRISPR-associated exonuclease Cas4
VAEAVEGKTVTADTLAIGAALFAVGLTIIWWSLKPQRHRDPDAWLPEDLRTAKLVYAERLFQSKGLIQVSAKMDRAYRDGAGRLILVELKTRRLDTVYPSDVIELSAQRAALMAATGEAVRAHAYVLVQGTDGQSQQTHRVELLTEAQVAALAQRRQALLSGAVQARPAYMDGICKTCVFAAPCRGHR